MTAAPGRCFARLANLFAHLAQVRLSPALCPTAPPLTGAHAEAGAEGPGEGGGRREAMIERHLEDAGFPIRGEDARGLLDPLPLDIGEEGLTGEREEDPMKMERRERRQSGQPAKGQRLGQPLADVVDDAIDALLVFGPGGV